MTSGHGWTVSAKNNKTHDSCLQSLAGFKLQSRNRKVFVMMTTMAEENRSKKYKKQIFISRFPLRFEAQNSELFIFLRSKIYCYKTWKTWEKKRKNKIKTFFSQSESEEVSEVIGQSTTTKTYSCRLIGYHWWDEFFSNLDLNPWLHQSVQSVQSLQSSWILQLLQSRSYTSVSTAVKSREKNLQERQPRSSILTTVLLRSLPAIRRRRVPLRAPEEPDGIPTTSSSVQRPLTHRSFAPGAGVARDSVSQ